MVDGRRITSITGMPPTTRRFRHASNGPPPDDSSGPSSSTPRWASILRAPFRQRHLPSGLPEHRSSPARPRDFAPRPISRSRRAIRATSGPVCVTTTKRRSTAGHGPAWRPRRCPAPAQPARWPMPRHRDAKTPTMTGWRAREHWRHGESGLGGTSSSKSRVMSGGPNGAVNPRR